MYEKEVFRAVLPAQTGPPAARSGNAVHGRASLLDDALPHAERNRLGPAASPQMVLHFLDERLDRALRVAQSGGDLQGVGSLGQ